MGGTLTLVFSLLSIWRSATLIRSKNLSQTELIQAKNIIVTSFILLAVGIGIFTLFILHLIY